jgi:hypothetical protein
VINNAGYANVASIEDTLLAGQAVDYTRPVEERRLAELRRWEKPSRSVDA